MKHSIVPATTLHPQSRVYMDLIKPDMVHGPWIAGGAPRHWFNNQMVSSDVDVFCSSPEQISKVLSVLKKSNYEIYFSSSNAYTLAPSATFNIDCDDLFAAAAPKLKPPQVEVATPNIQVVVKQTYNSPKDVLDDFDITVCQFLIASDLLIFTPDAIIHNEKRILHVRNINNPKMMFLRLLKYQFYGYTPDQETIDFIDLHRDEINFTKLNHDEY